MVAASAAAGEALGTACGRCSRLGASVVCREAGCHAAFHYACALAACACDDAAKRVTCPKQHRRGGGGGGGALAAAAPAPRRAAGFYGTYDDGVRGALRTRRDPLPPGRRAAAAKRPAPAAADGDSSASASGSDTDSDAEAAYAAAAAADDAGGSGSDFAGDGTNKKSSARPALEPNYALRRPGRGRGRGRGRVRAAAPPSRERRGVASVDYNEEQQDGFFERQTAAAAAARQAAAGKMLPCTVCALRRDQRSLLRCTDCGCGFHMACLQPPLEEKPLAAWFCPECMLHQECEACGLPGAGSGRAGATAAPLRFCPSCGGVGHAGCQPGGECALCAAGVRGIDAVLGSRDEPAPGAAGGGGDPRRLYFVKPAGACHRRCRWVSARAARRLHSDRVARFERDNRGRAAPPAVPPAWSEVERVLGTRGGGRGGQPDECLVKWRSLDHSQATWEPAAEVEPAALAAHARRAALRVVRDAAAEAAARAAPPPAVGAAPAFLGTGVRLKDYQVEGVDWMLAKLHARQSVILGDEMGLGKTIQVGGAG
jgi:hypothetical protein